ncbi:MAG: hypothetical protein KDD76_01150, partial [Rickettsiales bacterium]|nr:hypothetical protein [Rickettsiales bacterium]
KRRDHAEEAAEAAAKKKTPRGKPGGKKSARHRKKPSGSFSLAITIERPEDKETIDLRPDVAEVLKADEIATSKKDNPPEKELLLPLKQESAMELEQLPLITDGKPSIPTFTIAILLGIAALLLFTVMHLAEEQAVSGREAGTPAKDAEAVDKEKLIDIITRE